MVKLALTFIMFLISCSFLSATFAAPARISCPPRTSSPGLRICTADYVSYCVFYKDGSAHQYQGSSSCVCSSNPNIVSYHGGFCSHGSNKSVRVWLSERAYLLFIFIRYGCLGLFILRIFIERSYLRVININNEKECL